MSDQIWVAIIATIGVIAVPTINHTLQLRKSRQAGVTSADVQAQPAAPAPATPADSWRELVQSLQERLDKLDERLERVETDLKIERDMRWLAIQHLRRLYSWIADHMPGHQPPPPPADLAPYIVLPGKDTDQP